MKKRLLIMLLVLLLAIGVFAVSALAADESALPTTCEHCKKEVTWTALDETELAEIAALSTPTLNSGHYYLDFEADSYDAAMMTLAANKTVCLYLNGKTLNGTTRAFVVRAATLNIMGDGTIIGHGTANTTYGGTVYGDEDSTINLYGGDLTFSAVDGLSVYQGGVLYVAGECNVYGGSVSGGVASQTGGCCFVAATGHLNMFRGSIGSGTNTTSKSMYSRGYVKLSGDASIDQIYMNPGSGVTLTDMVTISGSYSGTVQLRFTASTGSAMAAGSVVGVSDNAYLRNANITLYNSAISSLYVVADGTELKLSATEPVYPANTRTRYCEHCQKDVVWTGWTEEDALDNSYTYLTTGHYYLDFAGDSGDYWGKTIVGYDLVCIDLNGKHLRGLDRPFVAHKGTLNIMDTVGGGVLSGQGCTDTATNGGTVLVKETGTFNLYSGKLTYEIPTDGRAYAGRGGVVYTYGVFNMYGGEISGGAATAGANVYIEVSSDTDADGNTVYYAGEMNMYGGTIGGYNKLPSGATPTGLCVYSKGYVTLAKNAQITELRFAAATGGPEIKDMLTISGAYTGTVKLRYATSISTDNIDVGTNDAADLSGASITIHSNSNGKLIPYAKDLLLMGSSPAVITIGADNTISAYADLAVAVENYTDGKIALMADAAVTDLNIDKDVCLDLNGYDISGSIIGDKTIYAMDFSTDDYAVTDENYGTVTATVGCQIAGLPVDADCAEDGYLMIEEDGVLSFHRLTVKIKSMSLRSSNAGVYFTADFNGDKMVRQQVDSFGIALRISEAPTLDTVGNGTIMTDIPNAEFGSGVNSNSVLVKGFIKTDLADDVNLQRAGWPVYATAYVKIGDACIFGQTRSRSLQEQLEAVDTVFGNLTVAQMKGMLDMYDSYTAVLDNMTIPNIQSWDDQLETLAATDYTPYLSPDSWSSDVAAQAVADGKLHYYFMSGEGLLISETQAQTDKWGDACLIVFPNGENMLVDTGPQAYGPVLTQNLLRMGVTKINYLVITHPHNDHLDGTFNKLNVLDQNGFLNKIQVEQVLHRGGWDPTSTNSTLAQRICDERGIAIDIMEKGDIYEIGGVKAEVIWPLAGTGDTLVSGGEEVNNMSIVIRFDYGKHSSLFTADLYLSGEEMVMANTDPEVLDVDFLKVPHHGYLTSSGVSFLNAISPKLAVSTGCLNIPAKLRTRYADCGIEYLDDGTRGYIHVTADTFGEMVYETTRNDEAVDGGEVNPDEEAG